MHILETIPSWCTKSKSLVYYNKRKTQKIKSSSNFIEHVFTLPMHRTS